MTKEELIDELYYLIKMSSHFVPYEDDPEQEYEVIETADLKKLIKIFED